MKMVIPSHIPGSASSRYHLDAPSVNDAINGGALRKPVRRHLARIEDGDSPSDSAYDHSAGISTVRPRHSDIVVRRDDEPRETRL